MLLNLTNYLLLNLKKKKKRGRGVIPCVKVKTMWNSKWNTVANWRNQTFVFKDAINTFSFGGIWKDIYLLPQMKRVSANEYVNPSILGIEGIQNILLAKYFLWKISYLHEASFKAEKDHIRLFISWFIKLKAQYDRKQGLNRKWRTE